MARTFISGVALAVAAALAIAMDSALGLGLGSVLFGVAVGGALGLSVDGSAAGRAGAYAVGVVVAVAAYLVRVLLLPDSSAGLIVFAVLAVLVTTAVCALTGGRLPLSGGLLGLATIAGGYEAAFVAAPQNVQAEIVAFGARAVVPVGLAFLAVCLIPSARPSDRPAAPEPSAHPQPSEV